MSETSLGQIARIQIQRSILKFKGLRYDPTPLLEVSEAAIGPLGITGIHDGAHVMEVHHAAHPSGRGGGTRRSHGSRTMRSRRSSSPASVRPEH